MIVVNFVKKLNKNKIIIPIILFSLCFNIYFLIPNKLFLKNKICNIQESFLSETKEQNFQYDNTLTVITSKIDTIMADYPDFYLPIIVENRFKGKVLIEDKNANLLVKSWRYSYNARGIIQIDNKLNKDNTAIVIVHPWGIDNNQIYITPKPAGAVFMGTPEKNKVYIKHTQKVLNPFLKNIKNNVNMVVFSLPGERDNVRNSLYSNQIIKKSIFQRELNDILQSFSYKGNNLKKKLLISNVNVINDYFNEFISLDGSEYYNGKGFWSLPVPLVNTLNFFDNYQIIYDQEGYDTLKKMLKRNNIKHVLLGGYCLDKCVKHTTAGYDNLKKDFNVFIIGDATLSTYPASEKPHYSNYYNIANASLTNLITQISWIIPIKKE
jgi:hypothetical protein